MLKGIHKLEPGHLLVHQNGTTQCRKWFNISYEADESRSEEQYVEEVRETFVRVTKRQMASDVPLGAFLSGGVDSSAIVACMRQAFPDRPISCYTVKLDRSNDDRDRFVDDYPFARQVAAHLRVDLHEFTLNPDVTSLLPKLIWHMDEPDADPAIFPSYLISKAAREHGTTVLLSGTGGDEVFFGYRSHIAYEQYENTPRFILRAAGIGCRVVGAAGAVVGAQNRFVRRAVKFRRGLTETGAARHMALVDWSTPQTRARLFSDDVTESIPEPIRRYYDSFVGHGEINRHSQLLVQTFLASHNLLYTDKSSMAASVEVRVPFLDVEMMRLAARIPERYQIRGAVTKNILKKAMSKLLPHNVLHRSKTGFMAPLRKWIAHDMDDMIQEALSERCLKDRGLFRPDAVQQILSENRQNKADHAYLIYALLTLEYWMRTFIDGTFS